MQNQQCGCCLVALWSDEEIADGICDECKRIARNPERYEGDPEVDVQHVVRRVRSIEYQTRARAAREHRAA